MTAPDGATGSSRHLVHLQTFLQHLRRHEDQEFALGVVLAVVAEQEAEQRDIAKQRHLRRTGGRFALEHAAEHHGIATADQNLRIELARVDRSEEHTSELQSLMRISYAVFCLKNK